ncbi:MAG: MbnP family protein [Pseudomonadota bacterium]
MSRRKRMIFALTAITFVIAVAWLIVELRTPPKNAVTLLFHAAVGEEPLVFNEYAYKNPEGSQPFKIRDFRFFVSNIALVGEEGNYREQDSYHLARFDNDRSTYAITLKGVHLSDVTTVSFSIGIDPQANTSIESVGDLDPNSQMAWNWEVGYKFLVFEGGIRIGDETRPLVYHIGFDESRRDLQFALPSGFPLQGGQEIPFSVDVMKLFVGTSSINMAEIRSVKFDKEDTRLFADNFGDLIKLDWE